MSFGTASSSWSPTHLRCLRSAPPRDGAKVTEYVPGSGSVFSCGDALRPQVAADYLVQQLEATRASVVELQRGILMNTGVVRHPKPVPVPTGRPAQQRAGSRPGHRAASR